MSITPNMNLDLPTPSVTPGPTWADSVNAAFGIVDTHDHTAGNGVPVPTAGINIDDPLSLNQNALVEADYVAMEQQTASLGPSVVDAVYDVNGDLYFNNGDGTPVQITTGTSVNVSATALVPPGVIWPYGGSSAPTGFLMADGTVVSRTTYSALFLIFGTTFNTGGEPSTDFRLPNFNGRSPVGAGTYTDPVAGSITRTLGAKAGAATHVITPQESAAHDHGGGVHAHHTLVDAATAGSTQPTNATSTARTRSAGDALDYLLASDGTANATLGVTSFSGSIINSDGGNVAHNTMHPYLVVNYIIKY